MPDTIASVIGAVPEGAAEIVGLWVAALLTLAVLSYVFGSNPFFRFAEYLFVGVAAGYAAGLAWNSALKPRLALVLGDPVTFWYYGVFFILGILLLFRGIRSLSVLGNLPLGMLFGVGAALAIGGALTGSLVPQVGATVSIARQARNGSWTVVLDAVLLVLGTIAVLSAFHFTTGSQSGLSQVGQGLVRVFGRVGHQVMMIAFGALLAGAIISFYTVLKSRVDFLIYDWIGSFMGLGL